jgi:hypothetical protein
VPASFSSLIACHRFPVFFELHASGGEFIAETDQMEIPFARHIRGGGKQGNRENTVAFVTT